MLDIKMIRQQPEQIRQALRSRRIDPEMDALLELDRARRETVTESEALKQQRNTASKAIGALMKEGDREKAEAAKCDVREMGERINQLDAKLRDLDAEIRDRLLMIPNLPLPQVPDGEDETGNVVVRVQGTAPEFDFIPKPHWDLTDALHLVDFERGSKISGSGFPVYTGAGARIQRALIQWMLDLHTTEHGYTEIEPPFLCNATAMTGTGQLPKFAEDMYCIGLDGLYPVPTAEVPLTNLYGDEIIEGDLPIKLTAHTPCFRREAGAAGRDTRGLLRLHQFNKVELVNFCRPEESEARHEQLLAEAERVLQRLGLHYRVIELCTADLGFSAARCFDLELWAPGIQRWLEVSSVSNFVDYQARRANIRYRDRDGKPQFVHTLNGSGVALPRLLVALLESYQCADGSVLIPEVLRPRLDGLERLAMD